MKNMNIAYYKSLLGRKLIVIYLGNRFTEHVEAAIINLSLVGFLCRLGN